MARRTDSNQKEIVAGLRRIGATVLDLHELGKGAPDVLIGIGGNNYLVEIKSTNGKLTPAEIEFLASWKGNAVIVHNVEEAFRAIGLTIE